MGNREGRLIVIEGIDGSGKATQTEVLYEYLKEREIGVKKITFPDYESKSSALVKMYLGGEIAGGMDINVYAVSSFYTADRYISYKNNWEKDYKNGDIIVSDRYSTSNIVHQMVRLPKGNWNEYINWLYTYEFENIKLPAPSLVIYLDMHPNITKSLIEKRYNGDESKKDILEKDFSYMLKCRECALYAAEKLNWVVISCFKENEPLSIEEISEKIKIEINAFLTK